MFVKETGFFSKLRSLINNK